MNGRIDGWLDGRINGWMRSFWSKLLLASSGYKFTGGQQSFNRLTMDAARFSETMVRIYQSTRFHNPEDRNLYGNRHESLKSDRCDSFHRNENIFASCWGDKNCVFFMKQLIMSFFSKYFHRNCLIGGLHAGQATVVSSGAWRLIQFVHFRAQRRCHVTLTAFHIAM